MVNYLFLRLILRMERTTNPSVEVPSDAAIAAAITAEATSAIRLPLVAVLKALIAVVAILMFPDNANLAADRASVEAKRILLQVSAILSVAMLSSLAFLSFVS